MRGWVSALAVSGAAIALLGSADLDFARQERLGRLRTLGKAFYENPTTQAQAVEQFREAWRLNPGSNLERLNYGLALLRAGRAEEGVLELEAVQRAEPGWPHTWFNLGIEFKKQGEPGKAIAQFEQMVRLAPGEAVAQYNLGVLYKLSGRAQEAEAKFVLAAHLDPNLAAPHYQLFNAYRLTGRGEESRRALERFQAIKQQQQNSGVSEDVEWSEFSEIYETIDPRLASDDASAAALRFADATVAEQIDAASAEGLVLDADGDGAPDVLWTSAAGAVLLARGLHRLPLPDARETRSAAAGDFDNDGLADLCVVTSGGAALLGNTKNGWARRDAGIPAGTYDRCVWLDYDHDYDLDLLLLGPRPVLLRNQGAGGWADRSADFPFIAGAVRGAARLRVIPDGKALDLVVSYADRSAVLYRDRLGGRYEAAPLPEAPARASQLEAADLDHDSYPDLVYRSGPETFWTRNGAGKWQAPAPAPGFALGDLENHGLLDAISSAGVARGRGLGRWDPVRRPAGWPDLAAAVVADFDLDGRADVAGVDAEGRPHRALNRTATRNTWMRVQLDGRKNLKLAAGAEVEVKAGALYQKKAYQGFPLSFGLRAYPAAETVRITWPNGLIQNEVRQAAGKPYHYREASRLSGSCPFIWSWNGEEFEYISDVLGGAPLGAAAGDGSYFPTDHDEYVFIAGHQLRERNGHLEVRITEELSEVSYLDQLQLIALDHPAAIEVFSSDKWKAPPFPEFRLYGARRRVYPRRAVDDDGGDVTALVSRRDRSYPAGFARDLRGVAAMHKLDLDFSGAARDGRAVLVLSGWVDWADGSTFLAQAQATRAGLVPPQLQMRDARGAWVTVLADMGLPAGKPKTIAVDLSGLWPAPARALRIVTNLCVYWDEIFLSESAEAPEARLTALRPARGELRFRGFSPVRVHPQRRQPEEFHYAPASVTSPWNPTPGLYTRYGDVTPLAATVDDRLVIMGSGDELQLRFESAALPALPQGWRRDYLLKVDGWAKDRDANTAFSQSAEPLPFQRMSRYPYAAPERYPASEAHEAYRRDYNTRPALNLLRPLHRAGSLARR